MPSHSARFLGSSRHALAARIAGCALVLLLVAAARYPAGAVHGQAPTQTNPSAAADQTQPAPPTQPANEPATSPTPQPPAAPTRAKPAQTAKPAPAPEVPPISEDQIRKLLIGRDLFLRGGYLDNSLEFDEHGALISHSPKGSYTLCAIRVTHVRLLKHKVELEGERYGLHFLGALPGEDPTAAVDRVNITPRKKLVRITIDRELVVKEKPQKQPKAEKRGKRSAPPAKPGEAAGKPVQVTANPAPSPAPEPTANPGPATAAAPSATTESAPPAEASASQPSAPPPVAPTAAPSTVSGEAASSANPEAPAAPESASSSAATEAPSAADSDAAQAQAEIAEAPVAERPADAKSVTATHSQAHANEVLEKALDNVFAAGLDPRMMATMPAYWKLYYESAGDNPTAWPTDPSVLRQSAVDKKARLVSVIDPVSNEFAQEHGVAGVAEYHVVVGSDGKPTDIAVARPIGFGLDETAVEALQKASFEPAMKDGHAVPVMLDMTVEFRIYSKLTAETAKPHAVQGTEEPTLPGPYSVQH